MNKKLRFVFMIGIFALFLPLYVKADQYGLAVACKKQNGSDCSISNGIYQIPAGGKVKLVFNVTGGWNGSFSSEVSLSNNLTGPTDFEFDTSYFADLTNAMGPAYDNGMIGLIPMANPTGNPEFSFYVTAGNDLGDATVTLSDIAMIDALDQSVNLDQKVVNLSIVDSTVVDDTTTDTTDNTSTNTDNTETIEDTKTNTKKSSDTTKNPKTGVKVSLVSFVILAIGGVSYIVLRKKNYFNKI